jgi:dihydrofolate synthase/folylpolyglutamate synthase
MGIIKYSIRKQSFTNILNAQKEFKLSQTNIEKGSKCVKNTGLQGRWQQLGDSPK